MGAFRAHACMRPHLVSYMAAAASRTQAPVPPLDNTTQGGRRLITGGRAPYPSRLCRLIVNSLPMPAHTALYMEGADNGQDGGVAGNRECPLPHTAQ